MTDFRDVFTRAVVRKFAYVLVAAVLAWCGIGRAEAANDVHPRRDEAYAHAASQLSALDARCKTDFGSTNVANFDSVESATVDSLPAYRLKARCTNAAGTWHNAWYYSDWHKYTADCPASAPWDSTTHTCRTDCAAKPPLASGSWVQDASQSVSLAGSVCQGGCGYEAPASGSFSKMVDGVWYTSTDGWTGSNTVECPVGSDVPPSSPPPDSDGDGISDGNDAYPNDASNGSSNPPPPPPEGCGVNGNPPCPDDSSNDDADNKASGGAQCSSPPSCSGDGIQCAVLFQVWKRGCEANDKQSEGNAIAEAQKALHTATNEKLDAIKAFAAAQATASKQDDIKAAIDLSRAQLGQLIAAQTVEALGTKDAVNALKMQQAGEVAATQQKIDAFNQLNKAEQDETQAAITALNVKYSAEVAETNAKLATLNQLSMDALLKQDAPAFSSKIDTTNSWLATMRDEANVRELVRKSDADALQAMQQSIKESIDSMSAKASESNTWLSSILGKLTDMLDAMRPANDLGMKVNCPACPGGSYTSPTDMAPTNALLGAIKSLLSDDPGPGDQTGVDATAESVTQENTVGEGGLDSSGFGWSRSCPAPITVSVFGQTLTFDTGLMCSWLALGGWFVMLITGVICLRAIGNA